MQDFKEFILDKMSEFLHQEMLSVYDTALEDVLNNQGGALLMDEVERIKMASYVELEQRWDDANSEG